MDKGPTVTAGAGRGILERKSLTQCIAPVGDQTAVELSEAESVTVSDGRSDPPELPRALRETELAKPSK